jgi:hypothetical protein
MNSSNFGILLIYVNAKPDLEKAEIGGNFVGLHLLVRHLF